MRFSSIVADRRGIGAWIYFEDDDGEDGVRVDDLAALVREASEALRLQQARLDNSTTAPAAARED